MKNAFKSVFNLKTILNCYIGAIGYGVGYNLPKSFNLHPIICIISCLLLGTLFDAIANKLLSSKYFNRSLQSKISLASFIYVGYLVAWLIVNELLDYDLDTDFLSSILIIIAIQLVLLVINGVKNHIKDNKNA